MSNHGQYSPRPSESPWAASVGAQLTLKRADTEEATWALCERAADLTAATLHSAGLSPEGLDDILCTGGAWHWPQLTKEVSRRLGVSLHPSSGHIPTVAHGAALWGHARLQAALGKDDLRLFEVSGPSLQLQTPSRATQVVLSPNTRLPAEALTDVFEAAPLWVCEGDDGLGTLPPCLGRLSTHMDLNGVLSFSTSDEMNRPRRIELAAPAGLQPAAQHALPEAPSPSSFWAKLKARFG